MERGMRHFMREKGIPVMINDFDLGSRRTLEDELNGRRGSEYWSPREYSCELDYDSVDSTALSFLYDEVLDL